MGRGDGRRRRAATSPIPTQVDAATAATVERIGAPDLVTITAGIGHGGMLLDAPADDWDRVVGTNAKGVVAGHAGAGPPDARPAAAARSWPPAA